jgi:sugar lactone lactonase YvrE
MNKIKKTVLLLITACFFILCGCSSNKASETDVPVLIPAQGLNSDYSADQQYQILTPLSSAVNFGHGITLDSGDSFYITSDAPDNRVYKVSVSTGNTMAYFGGTGTGDGQFNTPFDIAWFNDLNLFVTDKNNNRVVKFNSSGLFLSSFNALDSGTLLSGPKGCAVTKSGYLFVVDSLNNRVVKFDINGNFKLQIGSGFGTGDYQMNAPTGIEVDNSGNLFIADTGNNRILKYTEEGVFVKKIVS